VVLNLLKTTSWGLSSVNNTTSEAFGGEMGLNLTAEWANILKLCSRKESQVCE
jgi:hypothetical protein